MKLLRVAIDNRLESLRVQEVRDFTTLRVLELSSINVHHLIELKCVEVANQDGLILLDVEKCYWSDGCAITAQDWIRGIQCAIDANLIIQILSKSICLKLSVSRNRLAVTSNLDAFNLLHFISIPIFSPLSLQGAVSGRYKIEAQDEGWIARAIHCDKGFNSSILFYVLEDPYIAVHMFNQGELDKTPESCLPLDFFEYNNKYLKKIPSDLFGYISFSREFSSKVSSRTKKIIFDTITSMKLSEDFEGRWNSIKYEAKKVVFYNKTTAIPKLKFSFDDVYPNKKFCEEISRCLGKESIETELISSDYGVEPEGWDLRFHIVHFYGLPEYWQAEFCRISGAKFSCQKVGTDYLARNLGGELNSFPVCNIPLRYLERS